MVPTQKQRLPKVPDGKKIMLSVDPNVIISIYTGVSKPQTGHIAKIEQINTRTPEIDMIGINYGRSFSKSMLFLSRHGPMKLM